MREEVTYIFRKPDPKYFSIESVFQNISRTIATHLQFNNFKVKFSGGNLKTLWSNLKNFKKEENMIYHITGDVHYMAIVTGKNSVLTIHDVNSALYGNFFKKLYIRIFWFWLPAFFVQRITVISEFTKTELGRLVPFAKHKIRVINNPVDPKFHPSPYAFNAEKPKILFIGTKPNKNLERSFEAIKDIPCEAMIIGKLTDPQRLLLKDFKIEYYNQFNLTFEEIVDSYKKCDLVCFASTYEGFGMPIVEAQATGRPIVTSDIGAMREVSNNSTCLVNPYHVNSIREAILKICNDQTYREQLINAGFENVKRFQSDHIAQKYIDLYKEILN